MTLREFTYRHDMSVASGASTEGNGGMGVFAGGSFFPIRQAAEDYTRRKVF